MRITRRRFDLRIEFRMGIDSAQLIQTLSGNPLRVSTGAIATGSNRPLRDPRTGRYRSRY
jgi:hypothetical protein